MVGKRGTARLGSSAGTNPRICHGFHYDHALYSAPLNALVREVPYLHHLREEGGGGSLGVGGGVGEGSLNSLFGYDLAAQRPIHVRWLITGLAESTFLPSV
jgi:hypothetical protein